MEIQIYTEEDLRSLLNSIVPIPDEAWNWLVEKIVMQEFSPDDTLFRPGSTDASIHFLRRGLVRYYYLTEAGRELNHTFAAEGNLVGCLPAFIHSSPCNFTVEALEQTSTLILPPAVFQESSAHQDYWQRVKLRLMEHVALRKDAREAEFLRDSAETRYRRFISLYEPIVSRIPQYHIASYLGVTPVALSRIRKRINQG